MDIGGALLDRLRDDRVHELDDRSVAIRLVGQQVALGVLVAVVLDDVLDRLVHAHEPRQQQVEVLDRGSGGPDPPAGHHADVVDREDVRRVGHRQQHRAVIHEAHRHRLVALGGLRGDQVDRAHVEVVDGQVDEVQAEALGNHPRELVVAKDPPFDEHDARRAPLGASGRDGLLDGLTVGEAEVDGHLADHARRATGVTGRVQAAFRVP